jgi:hypothetical protein
MDQSILLFLQRDDEVGTHLSLPYLSIRSIITNTYTRNKTIARNRMTALQFILSGKAERRKRINRAARSKRTYTHRSVRYINTNESKAQCKNPYQVVVCPMNGGNRP